MYISVCVALLVFGAVICNVDDDFKSIFDIKRAKKVKKKYRLNHTSFFPPLDGYHVNALAAAPSDYPYIAEVIHSKINEYPHVCTATCVGERLFITAARCIYTLKLSYARVKYQQHMFNTRAFVLPSDPTKQMFDDIGIIVVEPSNYKKKWISIKMYSKPRTDKDFKWFDGLMRTSETMSHRVVGYALEKITHKLRVPSSEFKLKYVDVVLGRDMCSQIFTVGQFKGFEVPCFHSCKLEEFKLLDKKCSKYLGEEGAPLINLHSNTLMGVSTWGAPFDKYELPVGLSVTNSDNFFKDYACAIKIRDNPTPLVNVKPGYFQSLCKT